MTTGRSERAVGNGHDPATYGFDLGRLLVPPKTIAASGLPRDGLPVLDFPKIITPTQADSLHQRADYKYLVSGDRVIGVCWGGHARAYPIAVMNWHEVVNDTLGGRPIAVTYSPLCDAAAVFQRQPGVLFGLSGLLCNSNLLMYDRRTGHREESLWSQLQARAISGPAADQGTRLQVLPCALVRWADWRVIHPETTVLDPEPPRRERYQRDPYVHDYGSDRLRFPVDPLPPATGLGLKTPCVIVWVDGRAAVYPLPLIAADAGPSGFWEVRQDGETLRFTVRTSPLAVRVETVEGVDLAVIYSFWYAWYAAHPDTSAVVHRVALDDRGTRDGGGGGTSRRPRMPHAPNPCRDWIWRARPEAMEPPTRPPSRPQT
jgi:hypothetical protein